MTRTGCEVQLVDTVANNRFLMIHKGVFVNLSNDNEQALYSESTSGRHYSTEHFIPGVSGWKLSCSSTVWMCRHLWMEHSSLTGNEFTARRWIILSHWNPMHYDTNADIIMNQLRACEKYRPWYRADSNFKRHIIHSGQSAVLQQSSLCDCTNATKGIMHLHCKQIPRCAAEFHSVHKGELFANDL